MNMTDTVKTRLTKDRPMTSLTLSIPQDVVDSLKQIAPHKGFSGYQALLKTYIGEGLRRDEAPLTQDKTARLLEVLKERGVSAELLQQAEQEVA
jgi:hypothetical protein